MKKIGCQNKLELSMKKESHSILVSQYGIKIIKNKCHL